MKRGSTIVRSIAMMAAACAGIASASAAPPAGFLHANGTQIVDGGGRPVTLRGMGLGGWMLQEGYMLQAPTLGQQQVIRARIADLVGEQQTAAFYRSWLDHFITRADVDAMARWGFNSIRLPMHYGLLMDPAAPAGTDRWRADGFARIDALVDWAARNRMYVFLDLHAAPGGQGADLAISDRDPAAPSLWESAENQRRTVALWGQLARRYAGDPWVGGYDILNEPNWDFDGPGGGNGCKEQANRPIVALYKRITAAIRAVDRRHMIVIEGNCWGNNYAGVSPDWDNNLALSFHKYWDSADQASLGRALALRRRTGVPLWMGESGENSNAWDARAVGLAEANGIGWAWWPLKKMGFNNPLEVVPNRGWRKMADYWAGKGPRPTRDEATAALTQLADHDVLAANTIAHRDVIDALFRQPHDARALPFVEHRLGRRPLRIAAVDYDLGPPGTAYADRVDADMHVASGGAPAPWNIGRTYRNDGVDIVRVGGSPVVTEFERGEWMQYSVAAGRPLKRRFTLDLRALQPATVTVQTVDGRRVVPVPARRGWQVVTGGPLHFRRGTTPLRVAVTSGVVDLRSLTVSD